MKTRNFLKYLMLSIVALFSATAMSQTTGGISVGDPAPEIKYSKWIKGESFDSFDPNKLYVMEFWATWCGPCKMAMPHLTKLQQQYKEQVTFVGVNVWEKIPQGLSYDSSLPEVEKFVKSNDANMGYSIISDNNEQYMSNEWLRAAGQNGIPATFIIKNSKIIWMGHPNSLDSIIPQVIDGSFDMQAFKEESDKRTQKEREQREMIMTLFKPIEEALSVKDYKRAFELMDKMSQERPEFKSTMSVMKFKTLLTKVDELEAIRFAEEALLNERAGSYLILEEVYKVEGLSPETYLWATEKIDNFNEITNPVIIDALATCYAKGGDYANAIRYQEQAVVLAEKALREEEMIGTIMDYTVEEYKNKLTEYKKVK